jgi:hypothetical protein
MAIRKLPIGIQDFPSLREDILGYPNAEVRNCFLRFLLPLCSSSR